MTAKFHMRADWGTYRRLVRYVLPYRRRLAAGFLCGIVFGGSTVGALSAVPRVLERFFDLNTPMSWRAVAAISALLIAMVLARGVGSYFSATLIQWVGNRVVMDLRVEAFRHLQDLSVAYYDTSKTGEMISRTVNDATLLERAVSTVISDLARQPILFVGALGYLFYLNWRLALVSLILFPLCLVPIFWFGRRVRVAGREGQQRLADIVSIMQEAIGGVRIVKAFGMEAHEEARFARECAAFFRRVMRVVRSKALIEPIIFMISALGLVLTLSYARQTGMSLNAFLGFGLALIVLYDPIKRLSKIHLAIEHSCAAADRLFEILDTPCLVTDRPGAKPLALPVREIRFEHVEFAYAETPVLVDIDLTVPAGEMIALVGGSGAGKTTLVNLLPRFFDVTGGRLLVNGVDVRELTLESLRRQIGVVTQETFLFNETVAANIAYGKPGATQAEIETAARRAHAHEFVVGMDRGYETMVGERGVRLSGGQRQRLAIARAILRNPPILLLDEATSALDTESERLVQEALEELMQGRTVFAIAHRLSTIVSADRIVVLDRGRIVELGTHQRLLAAGGAYRRLYELQFQMAGRGLREQGRVPPITPGCA
jgi:ATP-binding cassette, subfamily B, bacterial MsbA